MRENQLELAIRMMIQTDRMHKALIDERVSRIGMHRTQHMMLMFLSRQDKCPSQKEIADHFQITPAAVTLNLKKLEGDGYIVRSAGADTRFNEITITEQGKHLVNRSRKIFNDVDNSMFSGLSEEELTSYIQILKKIQNNIIIQKGDVSAT